MDKELKNRAYDFLIIGGGPAGTGLLLKAMEDGASSKLFENRIAVIERTNNLIKGNITQFNINSDTLSDVFLECLQGNNTFTDLAELKNEVDLIKTYKGKSIPLVMLDSYYTKLGILLKQSLESSGKCDFILNSNVMKAIQKRDNTYDVFIEGRSNPITAKKVLVATGGVPQNTIDRNTLFAKAVPLHAHQKKCIHSDTFLKNGLPDHFKEALLKNPKIVILGGSHSAFSAAHSFLHSFNLPGFAIDTIKIWSHSSPKIYFNTKEEARDNSYFDYTDADICPVTKRLYRLAGLRMDGRQLYMQMLGLGKLKKEDRVKLIVYKNQKSELEEDLDNAAVIVLAFGYRFNLFPFYNKYGKQIKFKGELNQHWVNERCELLDENGIVVPNAFASGLATGFIPKGKLGGEPSFEGQTNGIWYYQNAIADLIINNISEHTPNLS